MLSERETSLVDRLRRLDWGLVLILLLLALLGVLALASAGGGAWEPWAAQHLLRLGLGMAVMLAVAMVDIRLWLRAAYGIYGAVLLLLLAVEIMGQVGMGAQRWINLGVIVLQPSELMKVALILALARYFHGRTIEDLLRPLTLAIPLLLIGLPVALVLMQPNLGTALLLVIGGMAIFFLAGVPWWFFGFGFLAAGLVLPVGWQLLHDYQRQRLLTFLDPNADPLGAGYNILQSKIALGSGGIWGRGFAEGSQSQLLFLPEKQTDFIFVVLAEDFGLLGSLLLLGLYTVVLLYCVMVILRCQNQFGRLVAGGVMAAFFLYFLVNIGMVTGLLPVVGIPLPFLSYGGTALLTLYIAFGLLLSVSLSRHLRFSRTGGADFG